MLAMYASIWKVQCWNVQNFKGRYPGVVKRVETDPVLHFKRAITLTFMVEMKGTHRSLYHLNPGVTGIDRRLQSTRDEMVTRCTTSRISILAAVKEDCAADTWM